MLAELGTHLHRAASATRPNKSILIVEDDPMNRDALAFLLRHHGYRVTTAANGRDGLELLQDTRPDLILLDLRMPAMDGREFRRRLLEDPRLTDIPVVIVSGIDETNEAVRSLHVDGYLSKTAELATLLETVEAHCA
jgi:CheY-like chemotaxis protein